MNTENKAKEKQAKFVKEVLSWVKVLTLSVVVGLSVNYVVKPTLVSGHSMEPTLQNADYLLINRLAYKQDIPAYKDIVVFNSDQLGEILIKRVIGTEGDKVTIKDGVVSRNDQPLKEIYLDPKEVTMGNLELVVPAGKVFVLGDNRDNSLDSRSPRVGLVDVDDILGKVFVRVYPFEKIKE